MSLKQTIEHYLEHQRVVIRRWTMKKQKQKHALILEGLRIALDHIDEIF